MPQMEGVGDHPDVFILYSLSQPFDTEERRIMNKSCFNLGSNGPLKRLFDGT